MSKPLVFMMGQAPVILPTDRRYAENHAWALSREEGWRIGFSAYAVRLLGEIRRLEWSVKAGSSVRQGQQIGYVEASKATSDLYATMTGRLVELNAGVLADPTLINTDLYESGWLMTIAGSHETLLSPQRYLAHLEVSWPLAQRMLKGQVGKTTAAGFRDRLAALSARHSARPKVTTFYQVWNQPLMTVGGGQIISDAIHLCGGENVFGSLRQMAAAVTVEAVLAANPEAIVASGMGEARPEWLDDWRRWPTLTAVVRNNLFFVPPDHLQRHTPRILDGIERLCQHLETARARRPR